VSEGESEWGVHGLIDSRRVSTELQAPCSHGVAVCFIADLHCGSLKTIFLVSDGKGLRMQARSALR